MPNPRHAHTHVNKHTLLDRDVRSLAPATTIRSDNVTGKCQRTLDEIHCFLSDVRCVLMVCVEKPSEACDEERREQRRRSERIANAPLRIVRQRARRDLAETFTEK